MSVKKNKKDLREIKVSRTCDNCKYGQTLKPKPACFECEFYYEESMISRWEEV